MQATRDRGRMNLVGVVSCYLRSAGKELKKEWKLVTDRDIFNSPKRPHKTMGENSQGGCRKIPPKIAPSVFVVGSPPDILPVQEVAV